jgi:SAM-dependent methyltransferase
MNIETARELDRFYQSPDPWDYQSTPDDTKRRERLSALLPARPFAKALDIGCGNGFVTATLPAASVLGVDLSPEAIKWATARALELKQQDRVQFLARSLFALNPVDLGTFDLIVITGVLYPQYIGNSAPLVIEIIDGLLEKNGVLASCQIDAWSSLRFPYTYLDKSYYPYREYIHRLEIFVKT